MTDAPVRCRLDHPHDPHEMNLGFVDYDCPGVPITACRAELVQGARIFRCLLGAGHAGNHVNAAAGAVWAGAEPRMAAAPPRRVGRCGVFPPLPWHGQAPWADAQACVLPAGHTGWHHDDDGQEWSDEPAVAGLTAGQEIRARALDSASGVYIGCGAVDGIDAVDITTEVIAMADRFAAYIATGARPAEPQYQLVGSDSDDVAVTTPIETLIEQTSRQDPEFAAAVERTRTQLQTEQSTVEAE